MNYFKYISCVLFISCYALLSSAQDMSKPIWFYTKSYKDSVALRWHFNDANTWKEYIDKGVTIYRKDVTTGTTIRINEEPLKPFTDSVWVQYEYYYKDTSLTKKRDIDQNTIIALAMQHPELFPYTTNRSNESTAVSSEGMFTDTLLMRHFFHTMACFSSKEAGIVGMLYFLDDEVEKNKTYEYSLVMGNNKVEKSFARSTISTTTASTKFKPTIVYDYTNRRKSSIKWKKIDTTLTFVPFYNIYRSETKDKGYVKINDQPQLSIFKNEAADSLYMFYADTTLEKGKTYYYKVVGLDIFWEETGYSDPYVVREVSYLVNEPRIESAIVVGRKVTDITWSFNPIDKESVVAFRVYRSESFDTLYTPISKDLSPNVLTFRDEQPGLDMYYKVAMIGAAKDTLWTFPNYAHIPDSIAPVAPVILSALCDSTGVVTIKWKHNNEKDLFAYKIFKANHLKDEFSGVYMSEKIDSLVYDTLSLNTTSEDVYYMLQLLDKTYNESVFSNVVKVKRYDIIPPTAGVFYSFTTDDKGISLTWANSSSRDAVKTILYRKYQDEMNWHVHKTFVNDTAVFKTYLDTAVVKGQWYEYKLQTVDDNNLSSDFSNVFPVRAYDSGRRPPLKNVKVELNKKKQTVKLSWQYNETKVLYFQVFRGNEKVPLSILESTDPNVYELYDMKIAPGHRYIYRVKAVFKDGGESPFSEAFIIEL